MLERIDVAVFDVTRIIRLVTDQMLPESALPDAAFVAGNANGTEPFLLWQRSREPALDQPPARGEIAITRRQLPDRMQMIREHDERVNREGMVLPRYGDSLAQGCDMIDEQGFPPLQQVDRKERIRPERTRDDNST